MITPAKFLEIIANYKAHSKEVNPYAEYVPCSRHTLDAETE